MNIPQDLRAYQQAFFLNNVQIVNKLHVAYPRWAALDSHGWVRLVEEDR